MISIRWVRAFAISVYITTCAIRGHGAEGVTNSTSGLVAENGSVILSQAEVVSIFMGRTVYWANGTRITVFLQPSTSLVTKNFFNSLGIPPSAYFDALGARYSAGHSNVPVTLPNDIAVMLKVANTPGAIGYVHNANLIELVPTAIPVKVK